MRGQVEKAPVGRATWVKSTVACVLTEPLDCTSPVAGAVARVLVREGDLVQQGQDLLTLCPSAPPSASAGDRALGILGPPATRAEVAVRSPAVGVITQCSVLAGDRVQRRDRLVSLVREGSVQVLALFGEGLDPELAVGTPAVVKLHGAPARELAGRVLGRCAGLYSLDRPEAAPGGPMRIVLQVAALPLELLLERRQQALDVLLPLRASGGVAAPRTPPHVQTSR